jgi:hypothetical protein
MLNGSENAKRQKMAIRRINVQNVARKNMFRSLVNADYALRVEQKLQTNGPIGYIIFF